MQVVLDSFKQQMLSQFSSILDQQGTAMRKHVDKQMGKVEARQQRADERLDKHDKDLLELKTAAAQQQEKIKKLETAAALPQMPPEERTKQARLVAGNMRDPFFVDPTILRINAASLVAKSAVRKIVDGMCSDAGIDFEHVSLRGADLGKRFTAAFAGDAATAARRATKCNETLREASGEWKKLATTTPGGDSVKIFVSKDEATAAIRCRKGMFDLWELVQQRCPSAEKIKRDNAVAVDWQVVGTVLFDKATSATRLQLDHITATRLGFDAADLEREWEQKRDSRQRG